MIGKVIGAKRRVLVRPLELSPFGRGTLRLDPVRVVYETVEDGVGDRGMRDVVVPVFDWQLAGDDLLARIARVDQFVIDDFAIAPWADSERRDLLEVLEDRHGTRSTIVTSQLVSCDWHDYLADPTLADAICDRLVHHAHRLVLKGPSRTKNPASNRRPDQRRSAPITMRGTSDHHARNAQADLANPAAQGAAMAEDAAAASP